jgi:hypothetical protein
VKSSTLSTRGWQSRTPCAGSRWYQAVCEGIKCTWHLSDGRSFAGEELPGEVARFCIGE